jgi:hypothetical protein
MKEKTKAIRYFIESNGIRVIIGNNREYFEVTPSHMTGWEHTQSIKDRFSFTASNCK